MFFEKWMKWTVGEGIGKTAIKLLQKVAGNASNTFGLAVWATIIGGIAQTIAGFLGLFAQGNLRTMLCEPKLFFGACLYGFFFAISTILTFLVFQNGGDAGINTFIVTLAIVPGALFDNLLFDKPMGVRKWISVAVSVFAGYVVLGLPSLKEIITLPLWVQLSFGVMFGTALSQASKQWVSDIDDFVLVFWAGISVCVTCFAVLFGSTFFEYEINFFEISGASSVFVFSSIVVGILFVAVWIMGLWSYKDGAYIALKKLIYNGVYLILIMFLGAAFFPNETITFGKFVGVGLYLVAFAIMDDRTYKFFTNRRR